MAVTLKEVAERAGVSRSAVSRAFTPGASVSPKTRAKVEKAADELGYSPNALASSLTTGHTKLIGLVSNNFHNPVFLTVFDQFTRGLQQRGLRPLLVNLSEETEPQASLRMLRAYSVDGVIIASSTLPAHFAEAFQQVGVPVVHSFGRLAPDPKVHVLGIDNIAAGRLAAETLLARGYRRLAFLGGPEGATSTQDRQEGFAQAMAGDPAATWTVSYAETYSFAAGRATMLDILKGDPAEAYFCGDDVLSIGALSAIQSAGRAVPDDIGILGLNDMEMAGWANINLTTIHNPIAQIIDASIALITASLRDADHHPKAQSFDCTIVERGTLRPLPAPKQAAFT